MNDDWTGNVFLQVLFQDDHDLLPACRNDHEFEFARRMDGHVRTRRAILADWVSLIGECCSGIHQGTMTHGPVNLRC